MSAPLYMYVYCAADQEHCWNAELYFHKETIVYMFRTLIKESRMPDNYD